jgi:hypothetical protein
MLEDRLVPAASSVHFLQAVAVNNGSAVFFQDGITGDLREKTPSGATTTLISQNITSQFSAGVDSSGNPDVFAQIGPSLLLEFNARGSQAITAPVNIKEFAAVHGDRFYMVGTDGSLWGYSPPRNIFGHPGGF